MARTIPEIVMSFNQPGKKPKENIALKLLLKIGTVHQVRITFYFVSENGVHIFNFKNINFQNANKLTDLTELIMAGLDLEADDVLISNTIQVLNALLQNFTQHLTLNVLNLILEQVLAQLITGSRQKVKTAIGFLMTFIKILPASYVANHLPNIVKTMSAMKPDTKRFYRKQLGFTYKRLCKRFTPEEIVKLVPGNDEITHKKLKNIRKALARSLRRKEIDKSDSDDDGIGDEDEADSYVLFSLNVTYIFLTLIMILIFLQLTATKTFWPTQTQILGFKRISLWIVMMHKPRVPKRRPEANKKNTFMRMQIQSSI